MDRTDTLFVFGALCVAAGVALIYIPAGVIVLGVFALAGALLTGLAEVARARRLEQLEDQEKEQTEQPELAAVASA